MLHTETVSQGLLDLTSQLMMDHFLDEFRLVGGTALSLQSGHRISIDIDMFSAQGFDLGSLHDHIIKLYSPQVIQAAPGIIMARVNGIKIDFIAHRYPWIDPPVMEGGFRMASLREIAAMKLNAISDAGHRQKDFVDMYYLLEKYTLNEIADAYAAKYPESIGSFAKMTIREFDRVLPDETLKLLDKRLNWDKIQKRLREAVLFPQKIFNNKLPGRRRGFGL